jgi:hypothetical protein
MIVTYMMVLDEHFLGDNEDNYENPSHDGR